jgi:hypothetical protein
MESAVVAPGLMHKNLLQLKNGIKAIKHQISASRHEGISPKHQTEGINAYSAMTLRHRVKIARHLGQIVGLTTG